MGPELLEPAVGLLCTFWVWKKMWVQHFFGQNGVFAQLKMVKNYRNMAKITLNGPKMDQIMAIFFI